MRWVQPLIFIDRGLIRRQFGLRFMENSVLVQSGHLRSIDGWRAFAILCVVVSHFPYAKGGEFIFAHRILVGQGDFGVRVFLVISGFLITFLLFTELKIVGKISLSKFYARRALRIFPVYFAYVGLLAALSFAGIYADSPTSWFGSLTFTRNVIGVGQSATVHFWSLAVEEQFYLLWPIFFLYLTRDAGRNIDDISAVFFTLISVIIISISVKYINCFQDSIFCKRIIGPRSLFIYMDSLAVGCFAALLYVKLANKLARSPFLFWISTVFLVLLRSGFIEFTNFLSPLQNTTEAITVCFCILHTIDNSPILFGYLLNNRISRSIGVVSYSLYVWHILFLDHFMRLDSDLWIYIWKYWWIPSIFFAYVSYYAFEKPILGLRKRLQSHT